MKKITFLLLVLPAMLLQVWAQSTGNTVKKRFSGLAASVHGGYDILPFYNNNTPCIDYKGGIAAGASVNYYWNWFGLGPILII